MEDSHRPLICLTGATGYIGGRLLPLLEQRGERLRCLARRPESLLARVGPSTEVVQADVLEDSAGDKASPADGTLDAALQGVDTAYYLIHSMGTGGDFERNDRRAARNFAAAARRRGVRRIIYLGGLGDQGEQLSPHLRSRQEVGEILRQERTPVIELRASIIIGSGSLSFELIRALVERLPVMICPRWVSTPAQPIAVEDVLAYLVAALDLPLGDAAIDDAAGGGDAASSAKRDVEGDQAGPSEPTQRRPASASRVYEIGGPDPSSYKDIMRCYAEERGLRRWMISVPVLTPRLSSLWLGLVTPVYARVGRKLIEGLRNPTVVRDPAARTDFPIVPRGLRQAIRRALVNEDREFAQTRWSDALSSGGEPGTWGGQWFGNRIVDSRAIDVPVPAVKAFDPIQRIGGQTGWYFGNWLWRVRGLLDLMIGGVGMRRGRRHPTELCPGDALDFWRVETCEPNRRLRLSAEMRLPGRAWLEFEVEDRGNNSTIRQTAIFDPIGWSGLAYWYALYPLHELVFRGMLRGIARAARRGADS